MISENKEAAPSWATATSQWFVGQLRPDKSEPQPITSASDVAPDSVMQLKKIASAKTLQVYFPKSLEQRFLRDQREANRSERLFLTLFSTLLFALAPVWTPLVLNLPPASKSFALMLCLGLAVPAFGVTALLQWRAVASELAESMLLLSFSIEVAVIEILRLQAHSHGFYICPTLTAAVPVAVLSIVFLNFQRRLLLVIGYFAVLVISEQHFGDRGAARDATEWMAEIFIVGTAFGGALFARVNARRLWAARKLLESSATTDSLTGLPNRSAFEAHYEQQQKVARRDDKTSVLALIDLDHFKLINDHYGHAYGDGVLTEVGLFLRDFARRPGDIVARVGGEEFVILLYGCSIESGQSRLTELLDGVRHLGIDHKHNAGGVVTVSIGATVVTSDTTLARAYQTADQFLYMAKVAGRDTVLASSELLN